VSCDGPRETVDAVIRRTVWTRPKGTVAEWLELLGFDATRFDLARPGGRMILQGMFSTTLHQRDGQHEEACRP